MDKKGDELDEDYQDELVEGIESAEKKFKSIVRFFMGENQKFIRELMKGSNRVNTNVLFKKKEEIDMAL